MSDLVTFILTFPFTVGSLTLRAGALVKEGQRLRLQQDILLYSCIRLTQARIAAILTKSPKRNLLGYGLETTLSSPWCREFHLRRRGCVGWFEGEGFVAGYRDIEIRKSLL
jgi:hypothetical protein